MRSEFDQLGADVARHVVASLAYGANLEWYPINALRNLALSQARRLARV